MNDVGCHLYHVDSSAVSVPFQGPQLPFWIPGMIHKQVPSVTGIHVNCKIFMVRAIASLPVL